MSVPIGAETFAITLFSGQNASGSQLAAGSVTTAIAANQRNTVTVAFSSVVNSIKLVLCTTQVPAGTSRSVSLVVEALDADGNIIAGPGGYEDKNGNPLTITLSNVDNAGGGRGRTTLASTTVTGPTGPIKVSYNGLAMYASIIGATTSGPIAGGITPAKLTIVPTVFEYFSTRSNPSDPLGRGVWITCGADGNLWFTDFVNMSVTQYIAKMSTSGSVALYGLDSALNQITTGPDGRMWFAAPPHGIGAVTHAGIITQYPITTPSDATGIITGPDGNLWFTENFNVGKITTGGTVTEYPIPGLPFLGAANGIAVGSDGNLWFTVQGSGGGIGRITTSGTPTLFPLPAIQPNWIASGPDGNLWFTGTERLHGVGGFIGKITTAGTITEYAIPTPSAQPEGIVVGPDGNLWFAEVGANQIGKITTTGIIAEYSAASAGTLNPIILTVGPDGNFWFTNQDNTIGVFMY